MGWLYVPGMEGSSLDCILRLENSTELFVTSSGKPMLRPRSWRGWRTRPFVRHLCGTMLKPSIADAGVDGWISSLGDTRASRSASRESDWAPMMSGIYGRIFSALCSKYARDGVSSRTSQLTFPWDSISSEETFGDMAMRLRRESTLRRKWATANDGTDCLFWPTAGAVDVASPNGNLEQTGSGPRVVRADGKTYGAKLVDVAAAWPSPCAMEPQKNLENHTAKTARPRSERGGGNGLNLASAASAWQTPTVGMMMGGGKTRSGARNGEQLLKGQAEAWSTPIAREAQQSNSGGTPQLSKQIENWPAPAARDSKGANRRGYVGHMDQLPNMVQAWATPMAGAGTRTAQGGIALVMQASAHGPLDREIVPDGSLSTAPIAAWPHQSQRVKLNVYFVEWLMGLCFGWTGAGCVEMAWFLSWRRSHSWILRRALLRELERPEQCQ